MKNLRLALTALLTLILLSSVLFAQEEETKEDKPEYEFNDLVKLRTSAVENQGRSGTCWAFANISFIESEIMRKTGDSLDLSEMYLVRTTYPDKARQIVRMHGRDEFGPGGLSGNAMATAALYGIMPESVYDGQVENDMPNHGEMDAVLGGILKSVTKDSRELSDKWPLLFDSALDIYLGEAPAKFQYEGAEYDALSFMKKYEFNPEDYVQFTSYSHHPFYEQFMLEIPDNWANKMYYNIPLDELTGLINHAIENGYTVAWDGDVSERGFSQKKGVAILPEKDWQDKSDDERSATCESPEQEKTVTQELRQKYFDNLSSTDDHLMHITGMAEEVSTGARFYLTKNSWGTKDHKYAGFIYMSEPFVKAKTVSVMVHKDAVPENLAKKTGIK